MATYTQYPGADGALIVKQGGSNAAGAPVATVIEGFFDASLLNLAAADVVEVMAIPAGTMVYNVMYEVLVGDATQTIDFGDATDADGWIAVADVATAGNVGVGAGAYAGGKFYATADTLDITVPATKALDTLKIRFVAHVVMTGING